MKALFTFAVKRSFQKEWESEKWHIVACDKESAVVLLEALLGRCKYKLIETSINLIIGDLEE